METSNINQTVNNMDDLSSLMETTNIKKQEEIDEILGDPIEEVEIPKEETPKEEGEK